MPYFEITTKQRLAELRSREKGYFDLEFIKALPEAARPDALNALNASRAQLRQDLLALALNGFKSGGFFVEFGATNGVELSNSWLLENEYGWQGILAEPAQAWHADLKRNRNCTIETKCVWIKSGETLKFTEAPRGENSGISAFVPTRRQMRGHSYDVETISLNDLLETHNAPGVIDYMSVDTEGSEFDILNAFDFDRWQMRLMTIEHNFTPQRDDIFKLLTSKGYRRIMQEQSRFDDWYVKDI